MGKDSLLKSTSKKKTSSKAKKAVAKRTITDSKRPKVKASKKTRPAKKTKGVATPKVAKKATSAGKPTPLKTVSKKVRSAEKLILKKFKPWKPQRRFRPVPDKAYLDNFVAPPLIPSDDAETARKLKEILFRKFDLSGLSGTVVQHPPSPAADGPKDTADTVTRAHTKRMDPMAKMMTYLVTGLVFIMALIVAASVSNRANYYIAATDGAVEIWRGRFAPLGEERIIILPGAQVPSSGKAVYTENEIKRFTFNYYLDRADTLLEASSMPDFEGIKSFLNMALLYGYTPELRRAAVNRMNTIDMMIYLYKADVAASKGTLKDYQAALGFLGKAAALDPDEAQLELVKKKIKSVEELIVSLQAKSAGKPETPPKKTDQAQTNPGLTESPAK